MVIYTKSGAVLRFTPYDVTLGRDYEMRIFGKTLAVRFIKVSPKGFNFLNLKTSRCVLKTHVYDRKYVGRDKEVPASRRHFRVQVPEWVRELRETP